MASVEIIEIAVIALVCIGSALAALWWMSRGQVGRKAANYGLGAPQSQASFIFEGSDILDATPAGWKLLKDRTNGADWENLRQALLLRFPEFPSSEQDVRTAGTIKLPATDFDDPAELRAEWADGIIRIDVEEANTLPHMLRKTEAELRILKTAMDAAPFPSWQIGDDGAVNWHNAAYQALYEKFRSKPPSADEPLFDGTGSVWSADGKRRVALSMSDSSIQCWFDVTMVQLGDGKMFYAIDVDAVVNAEIAQRNFVQTLAKTFAQLSIGLAIFDRNRQLALFNPALIDLTQLPADFLSARPNLLSFFDRLRDNQMMPEPKNYASWREQIAELVAAAADGRYLETWSLPTGQTYRVNGRPHPDGAVAFLFEDISAEVSLTRRFRSELKLGQSLLDTLEDAIVVFSSSGVLTLSNAAYRELWGIDPDSTFVDMTVLDAIRDWQTQCNASPVWGEIRDFIAEYEDRAEWDATVATKSGQDLFCNVHPIPGGATMVRFQRIPAPAILQQPKSDAPTT